MLTLDVMLKFWELLIALVGAVIIFVGALIVFTSVQRRRKPPAFYLEAGGVALSLGEERLLEAITRASENGRNLTALAQALGVDEIPVYSAARALKQKDLIIETVNLTGGGPRFDLSDIGNEAALARGYIKLL